MISVTMNKTVDKKLRVRTLPYSLQQRDGTSCGAFLIENLYCDLKSLRINQAWWDNNSPGLTEKIRRYHLHLLRKERPDYYALDLADEPVARGSKRAADYDDDENQVKGHKHR